MGDYLYINCVWLWKEGKNLMWLKCGESIFRLIIKVVVSVIVGVFEVERINVSFDDWLLLGWLFYNVSIE